MRKVRKAFRTVMQLIRGGVFAGNHRPIHFDDHSLAAVGQSETVSRMEDREDRFDQIQSALADSYRERDYRTELTTW